MGLGDRKKDHVKLTINNSSAYSFDAGFSAYYFKHNALPELDLIEIDPSASLLGRSFSIPVFISSMTGGYAGATRVNEIIATVCERENIPFGVGSQRAMIEDPSLIDTFKIARKTAPHAFIAGNIGGAQLIGGLSTDKLNMLVDSIAADALIVHLNPLQELMQPEGDRNFRGVFEGIARLVEDSPVPVIVKETGAGINAEVARKLLTVGVKIIDIAGAGGTSWARVENLRSAEPGKFAEFDDWGLPVVYCLEELHGKGISKQQIIASGGIRSPLDVVKALCLGAGFSAIAQPAIQAVMHNGEQGLTDLIHTWKASIRYAMLLLGVSNVNSLNQTHLVK